MFMRSKSPSPIITIIESPLLILSLTSLLSHHNTYVWSSLPITILQTLERTGWKLKHLTWEWLLFTPSSYADVRHLRDQRRFNFSRNLYKNFLLKQDWGLKNKTMLKLNMINKLMFRPRVHRGNLMHALEVTPLKLLWMQQSMVLSLEALWRRSGHGNLVAPWSRHRCRPSCHAILLKRWNTSLYLGTHFHQLCSGDVPWSKHRHG